MCVPYITCIHTFFIPSSPGAPRLAWWCVLAPPPHCTKPRQALWESSDASRLTPLSGQWSWPAPTGTCFPPVWPTIVVVRQWCGATPNERHESKKMWSLAFWPFMAHLFVCSFFFSVKKCAWLYIRVTGCLLIRGFLKPENPTPKGPRGQHLFIAGPWNPLGPEHTSAVNHSSCKLACATYTVFTSRFCGLPRLVQM